MEAGTYNCLGVRIKVSIFHSASDLLYNKNFQKDKAGDMNKWNRYKISGNCKDYKSGER